MGEGWTDCSFSFFFSSFHPLQKESRALMRGEVRGKPGLGGKAGGREESVVSRGLTLQGKAAHLFLLSFKKKNSFHAELQFMWASV